VKIKSAFNSWILTPSSAPPSPLKLAKQIFTGRILKFHYFFQDFLVVFWSFKIFPKSPTVMF
jgi:hypothetical protein